MKHPRNISVRELRKRLAIAKLAPGMAHLPSFRLVLLPGQRGPVCILCGGEDAPIVNGKHLSRKFCKKKNLK